MFYSTKQFGPISTSHRNWRAATNCNRDSRKCSVNHGYSRYVKFTFAGELDEFGWIVDFGDLKEIKKWFDDNWDHRTIVGSTDPELETLLKMESKGLLMLTVVDESVKGWGPSIEGNCKWVYDTINPIIKDKTDDRACIQKVEIWEHENNSAFYMPDCE